ncbi:MAG: hypothetical protein CMM25_01040 [Rhodospirillaceae bacterium]|nr:hypothetical protein [Rhodospirillaceae bacterium]
MIIRILFSAALGLAVFLGASWTKDGFLVVNHNQLAAQEKEKRKKPKTIKVQAMKKPTFERLTTAQEAIELKDYVTAEEALQKALADQKTNEYERASVWMTYAYLYAEQEDYQGAINAFESAINISRPYEGKGLPLAQVISTKYNLGQLYMVLERYQDAIVILEEWRREVEIVSSPGLVLLANAYFQIERYQTAIPLIIEAIDSASEPREPWFQLLLACYFEIEDYPKGADLLEIMVDMFSTKKTYFLQLAALYGELGKEKESFAVLVMADKQGFLTEESELVRLARMYMFHDTPIKAAEVMKRGFKAGTIEKTADHLEILANSYFNSREFDAAIPPLKEAADRSKKGALSYRLGQAYLQAEKWTDAEKALKASLKKKGLKAADKGMVWMLVGISQLERNRLTAAKKSMKESAKFKKTKSDANKWLRFLDQKLATAGL